MATETPIERAEWGLRRQWAGDFGSAAPVLAALEAHGNEVASAWVDTLHLSHWLAQPKGAPPTSVTSLRRFAGSSPAARRGAGFACLDLALYHFMTLDLDALRELDVLHGELARGLDGDTKVCRDTVTLYRRALEGEVAEFDTTADDVAKRAATMDLVPPLLAANAMRAYAALVAGNLTAARAIARRASRMSRTEALPQYEYLANTILASVRRRTGNPHLATRILMALAKLAPATWQPWLAWELAWSGNVQAATSTLESLEPARTETPRATSTRWFLAAIESARSGSDGAWQQAEASATAALAPCPLDARDFGWFAAAVDTRIVPPRKHATELTDWLSGESTDTPGVLSGFANRLVASEDTGSAVACVLVRPELPARRVLTLGTRLARSALDIAQVMSPERMQERREDATAILAFFGTLGCDETTFFDRLYAVPYDRAQHRGMLDTLIHRVREALGESADIRRDDHRMMLVPKRTFLVADPRCAEPLSDRILRAVAEAQLGNAKDLSEQLKVPLRTVQACLRELSDDGAFEIHTEGRKNHYKIVDTTFSEPTQH